MGVRNSQDSAIDLIKDIIFFFLTTAFAFGYFMLMLLIISFVSLSYIHFTIEAIVAISVVATIIVDIFYVRGKIKQRREERIARKNSDFFKRLENIPWMKSKKAVEEVEVDTAKSEAIMEERLEKEGERVKEKLNESEAMVEEGLEKEGERINEKLNKAEAMMEEQLEKEGE